jgi:hypothetical protein
MCTRCHEVPAPLPTSRNGRRPSADRPAATTVPPAVPIQVSRYPVLRHTVAQLRPRSRVRWISAGNGGLPVYPGGPEARKPRPPAVNTKLCWPPAGPQSGGGAGVGRRAPPPPLRGNDGGDVLEVTGEAGEPLAARDAGVETREATINNSAGTVVATKQPRRAPRGRTTLWKPQAGPGGCSVTELGCLRWRTTEGWVPGEGSILRRVNRSGILVAMGTASLHRDVQGVLAEESRHQPSSHTSTGAWEKGSA